MSMLHPPKRLNFVVISLVWDCKATVLLMSINALASNSLYNGSHRFLILFVCPFLLKSCFCH